MQPNPEAIYVISKTHARELQPAAEIAMYVQIWPDSFGQKHTLFYYDTDRGHAIPGKIVGIADTSIRFQDKSGTVWDLNEVTIDEYRNNLADYLVNGQEIAKSCKTTEQLWARYRNAYPD